MAPSIILTTLAAVAYLIGNTVSHSSGYNCTISTITTATSYFLLLITNTDSTTSTVASGSPVLNYFTPTIQRFRCPLLL